jgi:hypothetical protein
MEKPKEPNIKDFQIPSESNGQNYLGEPLFQRVGFIDAMFNYNQNLRKYNEEIEILNQKKLIRLVKNATEKYCLNNLKITKK